MSKQHSSGPVNRWRGEFSSAATETAFLRDQGALIRHDLTRSLSFCSAFYLAFALTDVTALGYHRHTAILFLARLAVAIVALAGVFITRHSHHPARTAYRAASAVAVFGMATFLLVTYLRPGDILLHGMSMAIMLIIVYLFIPNRFITATVIAAGASASFLALACALGTLNESHVLTMAMLLLLANLFGAAAARRNAHLWREQYWTQQILTNLSVRDPLTGAFNRRHLNSGLLEGEIARAHRHSLPLTLIMCDLDGFKNINDTHGHQAGDTLLQDFARLLLAMTREGIDTVVRYGGEEFLLILPDTGMASGHDLAERVRARLASATSVHGNVRIAATASFGVVSARLPPHSQSQLQSQATGIASQPSIAQALIAHADELMYAAKRSGRNRVHATEWGTQQAA